jgi:ubiquinone/menaquinone biosynthesis C-methylase UbiE
MDDVIREFWQTKSAEDFDHRARSSGRMEAVNRVTEIAKHFLSKEGAISVDLGCGTGLFAKTVGIRSIIGVDFSSPLLAFARKRMDTVWQKNIFDLQLKKNSVDNIISLFMIDDYPSDKKETFFRQAFSFLKPGGHFFFAGYSPNDERMGKSRDMIDAKAKVDFEIYLEDASFYVDKLQECSFIMDKTEILKTTGLYDIGPQVISLKREFILVVAESPANTIRNNAQKKIL